MSTIPTRARKAANNVADVQFNLVEMHKELRALVDEGDYATTTTHMRLLGLLEEAMQFSRQAGVQLGRLADVIGEIQTHLDALGAE